MKNKTAYNEDIQIIEPNRKLLKIINRILDSNEKILEQNKQIIEIAKWPALLIKGGDKET